MRKLRIAAAGAALLLAGLTGCIQPIPEESANAASTTAAGKVIPGTLPGAYPVYTFYDEDYQQGGFTYTYGGSSKVGQKQGVGADSSEYFLRFNLDQKDYSGAAVCLWNMSFDVSPYLKSGALVLQARGKNGGEKAYIALVDDEKSDGRKTVVKVPLQKYGTVTKGEWTTFVIPLRDFGKRGVAWDAAQLVEVPGMFQWDNVQEFRVLSNLNDNPELELDVDNVQIVADAIDPNAMPAEADWLDMDQNIVGPDPAQMKLPDEVFSTFFQDDIPAGGFTYVYGGRTATKLLEATNQPDGGQVLACYIDNDYSGVTMSIGNKRYMDLTSIRKTGTITMWVRGGPAAQKFMVGIMDNQGNDKKVQTKVMGNDYGIIRQGEWTQIRIPLKRFSDDGTWWDAKQGREIAAKIDWSKIQEIRISIARDENKPGAGKPVIFYVDQIQFTKTANGIYDPDAYWDAFKSDAPDVLLADFDGKGANASWKSQHGPTAEISISIENGPKGPANIPAKGKAVKIDFKPGDYFDVLTQLPNLGSQADWSKHYGLVMWVYTDKPFQSFDVTIQDRYHEYFIAQAGATKGWSQVLVPFRNFYKFPYYQPPEAKENNLLDLDGVFQLGFKPGGEVPATMWIDQISVTNMREIQRVRGPESAPATFTGALGKVVKPIGDIYGVNVGLWAPELIEDVGIPLHRALSMGTVRYPGGLRSDEEDWKATIAKHDFNVDTDEFLDWAEKVGIRPMFTANVGDGTPEMAAAWVKYVNQTRRQTHPNSPRVDYWEIGNEVYGNWHKYYEKWGTDGGVAYGKRCREFILAMKAVDPAIKITVVWQLTGKWNENVLKEVADVVDGINVHHYAQKAGSDNDDALLAVSDEADKLMEDVRHQVEKYGKPGKHYEMWLTEWNSVDFNPGPQILSHINAVFTADYLGHLAQSSLDRANIWALYNGRDKRNGDYGLLAVSADPQGLNTTRPTYWSFAMTAGALTGDLLQGKTDREALSVWMSRRPDGKTALLLVNKDQDTEFKTTLRVPGLRGRAVVKTLTADNSYQGPKVETVELGDGSVVSVPKRSVVTIVFE